MNGSSAPSKGASVSGAQARVGSSLRVASSPDIASSPSLVSSGAAASAGYAMSGSSSSAGTSSPGSRSGPSMPQICSPAYSRPGRSSASQPYAPYHEGAVGQGTIREATCTRETEGASPRSSARRFSGLTQTVAIVPSGLRSSIGSVPRPCSWEKKQRPGYPRMTGAGGAWSDRRCSTQRISHSTASNSAATVRSSRGEVSAGSVRRRASRRAPAVCRWSVACGSSEPPEVCPLSTECRAARLSSRSRWNSRAVQIEPPRRRLRCSCERARIRRTTRAMPTTSRIRMIHCQVGRPLDALPAPPSSGFLLGLLTACA